MATDSTPTPAARSATCSPPKTAGATMPTGTAPGSPARKCWRTAGARRSRCPSRRSAFRRATCRSGDSRSSASSAGRNEYATWSPVPRQFSHYSVSYAGRLTGISGVQSGSDLRITPFTTGQFTTGRAGTRGWDGDGDAGVDLKWGVTSSLLLDASYRTDFSQVEADEQQINLTRFSLFFPEKRQFFLESPASFQVGLGAVEAQRRDLVPFFTRRIGLSSAGQPIPVIGGLAIDGPRRRQRHRPALDADRRIRRRSGRQFHGRARPAGPQRARTPSAASISAAKRPAATASTG